MKTPTEKQIILLVAGFLLIIVVISHFGDHSEPSVEPTLTSVSAADKIPDALTKLTPEWQVNVSTDPMTSSETRVLSIESNNELQFESPYSGGSRGQLALRHWKGRDDLMLKISKGQFNCGSDDCVVHIKFDDGKIQVFSASEPSDGSTGVLFIQPYGRFLNALKRSKHVKIEAEYFKEGLQTLFFDIPTLDIPK